MSKTKLTPCPWCGQEPTLHTLQNAEYRYYYSCDNNKCHVEVFTAVYKSKSAATRAWNKCKPKHFYVIPSKCKECKFCRGYTEGPWVRNPHHCCELMYHLYDADYKVNPDTIDKNCPLKTLVIVD